MENTDIFWGAITIIAGTLFLVYLGKLLAIYAENKAQKSRAFLEQSRAQKEQEKIDRAKREEVNYKPNVIWQKDYTNPDNLEPWIVELAYSAGINPSRYSQLKPFSDWLHTVGEVAASEYILTFRGKNIRKSHPIGGASIFLKKSGKFSESMAWQNW